MKRTFCLLIALAVGIVVTWSFPWRWSSRHARCWYDNEPLRQIALSRGVARWVNDDLDRSQFQTGSSVFDGE